MSAVGQAGFGGEAPVKVGPLQLKPSVVRACRGAKSESMKALADALVYAVTYIDLWPDEREEFLDDDVGALESIASHLDAATELEKDALAEAAERALVEEQASGHPREELIESYSSFMESFFEGWAGNRRTSGS